MNFIHANLGSFSPLEKVKHERSFIGGMSMVGSIRHDFGHAGIVVFAMLCSLILVTIAKGLRLEGSYMQIPAIFCLHLLFYSITVSAMFFPLMTMPFRLMVFGLLFLVTISTLTVAISIWIARRDFSSEKNNKI